MAALARGTHPSGVIMQALFVVVLLVATAASTAVAQEPTTRDRPAAVDQLPRAVVREVVRLYDEPHALRAFARVDILPAQTVEGNVSVIDGPLFVEGRITGRILAINADVILRPGARVGGDILVVGGDVEGERDADIGGEIRVYRPALQFTREGERIIVEESERQPDDEAWWRRWERGRAGGRTESRIAVASAGAYNRVDGLPIDVGPVVVHRPAWGEIRGQAFAVVRTATSFRGDTNNLGHDLALEVSRGREAGVRAGGRIFNVNAPVESWQLTPLEYGFAAFLFRRDYQDFYGRHGGGGHVALFDEALGEVRVAYSHERWAPRAAHNPFTLLRGGAWRENPLMDAGRMHLVSVSGSLDTRNDDDRPWSGWFVRADVERGIGDLNVLAPTPPGTRRDAAPGRTAYARGFLDARRYNRVGPAAQLNFRLVTGGWLGGDPLPLQRRLSVSGAGALPGFDFRTPVDAGDVGTCTGPATGPAVIVAGRPALCDRIALAQVEYRGDLHFDLFGGFDWRDDDMHFRSDATWVVFADAGRGWLVGPREGELRYGRGELPPPGTFRSDAGLGVDFGEFGVFVAKALSHGGEPPNFLFRLRHRF